MKSIWVYHKDLRSQFHPLPLPLLMLYLLLVVLHSILSLYLRYNVIHFLYLKHSKRTHIIYMDVKIQSINIKC